MPKYPKDACAPSGDNLWQLKVWPGSKRDDKKRLLSWVNSGCRQRDDVDRLFDQYRALPEAQRQALKRRLERAAKS